MAGKAPIPFWEKPGASKAPHSFAVLVPRYLEWTRVHGYADTTVISRKKTLTYFVAWCETRSIIGPGEVTRIDLERYQRYLYHYRKERDGKPLDLETQHGRLGTIRGFFRWLAKEGYLLHSPAAEMELPKLPMQLPRQVMSIQEAEKVLHQPDVRTPAGLRARAILELLYSTGIRRKELAGLKLYDVDVRKGTIMIRQGKGRKDRVVPIGERACLWLTKYLNQVRADLITEPDEGFVFIGKGSQQLSADYLSLIARRHVAAAEINKVGSCHIFRHTMATLMLENGADIRYIQEMLGHAKLSTTQIYTKVSIKKLKEIHTATHPGAKLERRKQEATKDEEIPALAAKEDDDSSRRGDVLPPGAPERR